MTALWQKPTNGYSRTSSYPGAPEFQPGGDGLLFIVWDEGDLGLTGVAHRRVQWNCGGRIATPRRRTASEAKSSPLRLHIPTRICCAQFVMAMEFSSCPRKDLGRPR